MAGNRDVFNQAMNAGNSSAWDQEWGKAAAAFTRAVQEFPEDPMALMGLGLALLQLNRLEDALKVYLRARHVSPDDAAPLEKCADVLERLGRLQDAAQQYVTAADVYLAQRDLDKAIGNWERATRLSPGLLQIHYRLAQAYERTGQKKSAVREYLTLAFNFQRGGDKEKALQAAERAKRLEPGSAQVLNVIQAIESGNLMTIPDLHDDDHAAAPPPAKKTLDFEDEREVGDSHPEGPVGEATEKALAQLADIIFSGDLDFSVIGEVSQAIELQKIGEFQQSADAYLNAEDNGMKNIPMFMCMGAMFLKVEDWENAKTYFDRARGDKEYTAGAAHGTGTALIALGQHKAAAEQLINALRAVDTSLAMSPDEANQLTVVYNTLQSSVQGVQELDLKGMNEQFLKWLSGTDWKVRVAETRRTLSDRLAAEGADAISYYVQNTDTVEMVTRIDRYIKQGLLTLAMDEAFYVIEIEPTFLPVHQRVAQILMEEGRTQAAITKYNMVANSFLARDEVARAAEILNEVIAIAPTDINLHQSLIELLQREQQWEKLVDEYINFANAYYQLADFEQARATYQEAMRVAQRINSPGKKRAEILHKIADIDLSRLDNRSALRNYEQIRALDADDEKARRGLVELHFRLSNPTEAVKELDGLLRLYAGQRRGDMILSTLEKMVGEMPNDMALRSRLAAVYRQTNRRADAIAQLDALGELQLEAGLYQEACASIKQIMALQPDDIEQYKNLLTQLGC